MVGEKTFDSRRKYDSANCHARIAEKRHNYINWDQTPPLYLSFSLLSYFIFSALVLSSLATATESIRIVLVDPIVNVHPITHLNKIL